MADLEDEAVEDRRAGTGERRRNNRRTSATETPPYFEVFLRIAEALERGVSLLEQRQVTLPETGGHKPPSPRSSESRSGRPSA